jgi:hypothetical protein
MSDFERQTKGIFEDSSAIAEKLPAVWRQKVAFYGR